MDPERGELEPPSASTGLETPVHSSVPRTRGRGRKDEPSLTTICSLAGDRQQLQTSLSCSRATNPKTRRKAAKKTSNFTPVEKERGHRFGTRLYVFLSFSGESVERWEVRWLCFVFFCLCFVLFSCLLCFIIIVPSR